MSSSVRILYHAARRRLQRITRQYKDVAQVRRASALLHLERVGTVAVTAACFGAGRSSVYRWSDWFDEADVEGPRSLPCGKPVTTLTQKVVELLASLVRDTFRERVSKFGPGIRLGIRTDAGETLWVGGDEMVRADAIGDAAEEASPSPEASAPPTKSSRPERFVFYGNYPSHWIEGANDGHSFSLQFVTPPDEATLDRLGELFEHKLHRSEAWTSNEPWLWSDRFAHFHVGESSSSYLSTAIFLKPVSSFLYAAHRFAPIKDVVYLNAQEDSEDDPGTRKTIHRPFYGSSTV